MREVLKRREIRSLEYWASQRPHKPLVIRGARQVGKSTLVREFARTAGMPLLELNFERNPELRQAFSVRDPARILSTLTLLTGKTVRAGTDLLFLDEIQAAPEAIAVLRYFCEENPELHVVAAGSLIEFALADTGFSMPVGRIEYFYLGPLVFDDFLEATGTQNSQPISATFPCRIWTTMPFPTRYTRNISSYFGNTGWSVACQKRFRHLCERTEAPQPILPG